MLFYLCSSIARQDLDLTFLTSRLVVMSFPAEGLESAYRNHVEDVRQFLDSRSHPYMVVNISGRSYELSKFGTHVKIVEGGTSWKDSKKFPSLKSIVSLCDTMFKWLTTNTINCVVIHCIDGRTNSALLVSSFLLLIELFKDYHSVVNFFNARRASPAVAKVDLSPSQHRYLGYVARMKEGGKSLNFFSPGKYVIIRSVSMAGIPLFTKLRLVLLLLLLM